MTMMEDSDAEEYNEERENTLSDYDIIEMSDTEQEEIKIGSDTLKIDADLLEAMSSENVKGKLHWNVYRMKEGKERAQLNSRYQEENIIQHSCTAGEAVDGESVFIIKLERKKKKPLYSRLVRYAPSFIGPLIGAIIAAFLRN